MRICVVIGTRPEAIKMAPIVRELRRREIPCLVCVTGQHREILDQALKSLDIGPVDDLNLMASNQSLGESASTQIAAITRYFDEHKPSMVLVQGDTTAAFSAALAAFYAKIKIGHIEAGLRTWNRHMPWPEETHRVLISRMSDIHFAPTSQAVLNLKAEGVNPDHIIHSGNTIVDSLKTTIEELKLNPNSWHEMQAESMRPLVLITCHRRESFGGGIASICLAIRNLAYKFNDVTFVLPAHPNPNVRAVLDQFTFPQNVCVMAPLDYHAFISFLSRAVLVMTDSGGVQEEAVSLGKPLLVLRDTTERHEAVDAGVAKLVGLDYRRIAGEATEVLTQPFDKTASSIYGDGTAAVKIVNAISDAN